MRNGLLKASSFFILISISIYTSVFSEEIDIVPLINLDQIEPSYDSLNEDTIIKKSEDEQIINNENISDKELKIVSLNILNKITANVEMLNINIKENFYHGELRIYPIDCYLSNPEDNPETAIYLNIYIDSINEKIFSGWMLKSLPSISSIEHPIYDIWVNDCF
tara:strand:+ start:689 stop:1180 length:492 start_codon:yes stop_codon:yes gene_type:complete